MYLITNKSVNQKFQPQHQGVNVSSFDSVQSHSMEQFRNIRSRHFGPNLRTDWRVGKGRWGRWGWGSTEREKGQNESVVTKKKVVGPSSTLLQYDSLLQYNVKRKDRKRDWSRIFVLPVSEFRVTSTGYFLEALSVPHLPVTGH